MFYFSFFSILYIFLFFFFFLMIRRPPRSTLFPTRRSSDLRKYFRIRTYEKIGLGVASPSLGENFRLTAKRRNEKDRKSTRLNSSHMSISYAVFCLKKKKKKK